MSSNADNALSSAGNIAHRRRSMFFLGAAVAGAAVAMALQVGLQSNFAADEMELTGLQQGLSEAARECCGISALAVLAILAGLAEPIIAAIMLVLLAIGLSSYAIIPSFGWMVVGSLIWSQGLHVWMPLPSSMTLALAESGKAGHRLGQIQSAGAAGAGIGLVLALVLTHWGVHIRPLYALSGFFALSGAAACLAIPRQIKTPGPRLVLRRKYGIFYALNFLEGWRKQIFIAFVGYLLVKQYHTHLTTMLVLWIIGQGVGYVLAPRVGKLIDRVGERKSLIFYYACMVLIFLGYALWQDRRVLFVLFILDNAFFLFTMAFTTYLNRIAPPAEHTASLSMGVAVNHIGAVAMPLVGGLLWNYMGYHWVFAGGAAVAIISAIVSMTLPKHEVTLNAA